MQPDRAATLMMDLLARLELGAWPAIVSLCGLVLAMVSVLMMPGADEQERADRAKWLSSWRSLIVPMGIVAAIIASTMVFGLRFWPTISIVGCVAGWLGGCIVGWMAMGKAGRMPAALIGAALGGLWLSGVYGWRNPMGVGPQMWDVLGTMAAAVLGLSFAAVTISFSAGPTLVRARQAVEEMTVAVVGVGVGGLVLCLVVHEFPIGTRESVSRWEQIKIMGISPAIAGVLLLGAMEIREVFARRTSIAARSVGLILAAVLGVGTLYLGGKALSKALDSAGFVIDAGWPVVLGLLMPAGCVGVYWLARSVGRSGAFASIIVATAGVLFVPTQLTQRAKVEGQNFDYETRATPTGDEQKLFVMRNHVVVMGKTWGLLSLPGAAIAPYTGTLDGNWWDMAIPAHPSHLLDRVAIVQAEQNAPEQTRATRVKTLETIAANAAKFATLSPGTLAVAGHLNDNWRDPADAPGALPMVAHNFGMVRLSEPNVGYPLIAARYMTPKDLALWTLGGSWHIWFAVSVLFGALATAIARLKIALMAIFGIGSFVMGPVGMVGMTIGAVLVGQFMPTRRLLSESIMPMAGLLAAVCGSWALISALL